MATAYVGSDVSLEIWLSKATNVLNPTEDWEAIVGFCDRVNKDPDGPQTAIKLLLHKIQSPQEKESLLALTTLEACAKNCGRRFQQEIGKFRFLNEIIKLISPKFQGNQTSPKVKHKCVELMYSWSEVLDYEPKIKEAYQMLRKQGIIMEDPIVVDKTLEPSVEPPPPPPRSSIFDNEEKSKLLSRLLRSKNPDDLMAANRLIKNMVKQDEERTEKVSIRINQLEIVYNNVKLLGDMLHNYQPSGGATESDREIMKELYDNLEKQRPKLFRLASDTDETDESGITDILKANDEVIKVMALYEDIVNKADVGNLLVDATPQAATKPSSMADLEMLHHPPSQPLTDLLADSNHIPPMSTVSSPSTYSASLLDDQLLKLGLESSSLSNGFDQQQPLASQSQLDDFGDLLSSHTVTTTVAPDLLLTGSTPLASTFISPPSSSLNLLSLSQPVPPVIAAVPTTLTYPPPAQHGGLLQPAVQTPFQPMAQTAGSLPPVAAVAFSAQPRPTVPPPSQFQMTPFSSVPLPGSSSAFPSIPASSSSAVSQPLSSHFTASNMSDANILQPSPAFTTTSSSASNDLLKLGQVQASKSSTVDSVKKASAGLEALDVLGKSVLQQSLSASTAPTADWTPRQTQSVQPKIPMNQMSKTSAVGLGQLSTSVTTAAIQPQPSTVTQQQAFDSPKSDSGLMPLTDIFVPLETIQPGGLAPIVAYDKNSLKIMFHFGKDRPRPDVQVVAVSVMSHNSSPVKGFVFQAAVPKVMKVKLQPASATDLPAYNPILPPAAITQVMLIAHRPQDKVLLKFKITYSLKDAMVTDVGEVQFTDNNM